MAAEYPIEEVDAQWKRGREEMGSKEKFWFRKPDDPDGADWLFKFPTGNTGEHWSEKVAYEIASKMGIRAPQVELALCRAADGKPRRGSITQRFASKYELYHGNQILHGMDPDYNLKQKFRHRTHTVQRVFAGMDIFKESSLAKQYRVELAGYLIFDAVIGNVDRHHENWGILRKRVDGEWPGYLAPTFDHASSLGRELLDTGGKRNRERYLHELGIDSYAKRARGAIFISEDDAHGPSPLELVRWCRQEPDYRQFFEDAFRKLDFPSREATEEIVAKVPDDWMTPVSRAFALALLHYNRERLREIFQ